MDSNQTGLLTGAIIIYAIIMLAIIAFAIFIWWKIFVKAGYSGTLGLLMLVPIANLVVLLILAFGEWPILRELNGLRQQVMMQSSYAQRPQGSYPPNPQYSQGSQYPQNPPS